MNTLKNKTALVTGASSGIGKQIAKKLAQAGSSLILVARSGSALHQLAIELSNDWATTCHVITEDLSNPDCGTRIYKQVHAMNLHVDILINNAGFGTYGAFESIPAQSEQDEIAVNISALVALTHAFIPDMLSNGSGSILNIASTASFQPCAFLAVYAATKAFVLSFSEALWAEYQGRGIHVAALCPPAVDTDFIRKLGDDSVIKTSVFSKTITAEHVAIQAIKALVSSKPTHIIGFKNWLMTNLLRFVPRSLIARAGAYMLRSPNKR
jgi:short-subunit dehydrogenase